MDHELLIGRLRSVCLALPDAVEKEAWGNATFRVGGKIFAMEKRGDGRLSVWFKVPEGLQAVMVEDNAERFFVPPYLGHKGWIALLLDDRSDWDAVAALVTGSYRMIAPKRLVARIAA